MTKGENLKNTALFTILTAAALAMASFCVAAERVPGEKLDSGLGELPPGYTAAEFDVPGDAPVLGESLDSGLGELASNYDGSEYNQPRVPGEKLDSGLGALSFNDVMGYALSLPVRAESASAPQAAPSVSPRE
jgi:hypothetical protein